MNINATTAGDLPVVARARQRRVRRRADRTDQPAAIAVPLDPSPPLPSPEPNDQSVETDSVARAATDRPEGLPVYTPPHRGAPKTRVGGGTRSLSAGTNRRRGVDRAVTAADGADTAGPTDAVLVPVGHRCRSVRIRADDRRRGCAALARPHRRPAGRRHPRRIAARRERRARGRCGVSMVRRHRPRSRTSLARRGRNRDAGAGGRPPRRPTAPKPYLRWPNAVCGTTRCSRSRN